MRARKSGMAERGAFTLVEMLVVMLIIGTLASLLLVGVFAALRRGDEVKLTNDIRQLSIAQETFKTQFGFYPPSRIKLCKRQADYESGTTPLTTLDMDSIFYLTRIAPRLADSTTLSFNDLYYDSANPTSRTKSPWMSQRTTAMGLVANVDFVDWDGSGQYMPGTGTFGTASWVAGSPVVTLEGDQCLVFFLGGARVGGTGAAGSANPPSFVGYSGSQFTPMDTTGIGTANPSGRVGPYYDFDAARLKDLPHPGIGQASPIGFFSYLDPFGDQPYAYFSAYSNKKANSYNRYAVSDCPTLSVSPYAQGVNTTVTPPLISYLNPNTFQLISAGPDKKFGPGTTNPTTTGPFWTPATAGDVYDLKDPGYDDMSNFHDRSLGVSK